MKTNSILVVDDHPLIIEGVCNTLKKELHAIELFSFTNGTSAKEAVKERVFDIYIFDLELPDMSGYNLIEFVLVQHPEAAIIVNTMHEEIWTVNHLLQLGVRGIVLKSSSAECLVTAVNEVLEGKEYLCPRFDYLKQNTATYRNKLNTNNSQLTKRELAVLKLIVQGASTDEIGNTLCISVNTVETFRKNLMIKLDAKNVAHLTAIAIQKRLVETF